MKEEKQKSKSLSHIHVLNSEHDDIIDLKNRLTHYYETFLLNVYKHSLNIKKQSFLFVCICSVAARFALIIKKLCENMFEQKIKANAK